LRPQTLALAGPLADRALEELHVDKLFLGANGVDIERGVTTPNLIEADAKRAMLRSAREAILVADASKFGRAAFARICSIDRLQCLITDEAAPASMLETIAKQGTRVIVARAGGAD
jgi:DeoR/GlpR family transcriptional regulator of sugar metabolism